MPSLLVAALAALLVVAVDFCLFQSLCYDGLLMIDHHYVELW
jgi:hypothetical protein